MRNKLIVLVLALLLLTGCTSMKPADTPAESTAAIPTTVWTEPETTAVPTKPTTEPTDPAVPSLGIEAGSYQLRFDDPANDSYMDYYVFIPENATVDMPLVIFLHGDGEIGYVQALENNPLILKAKEIYGEEFPFIVVAPNTRVKTWIDGTVPLTLKNLIDDVVSAYSIDTEHLIITGHSRGAVGVWYMINVYGDYFSAAVPVSCYSWRPLDENVVTQVPIRAFSGNVEDYEIGYYYALLSQTETIRNWGGDAEITLHNGALHMDTPRLSFTEELFQWMLSQ